MGTLFITAKIDKCIAVAGDCFPSILEQCFKLCKVLDNDDTGNLPASHGGKQGTVVIRQCDIGKFVQHECHMNRQSAAAVKVSLIVQLLKDLCIEHSYDKVVGLVRIWNDTEKSCLCFTVPVHTDTQLRKF